MQDQEAAQERMLPPESGKTWLNTVSVVDGLIRQFTNELMGNILRLERTEFSARLEMECRRMNNLFLGIVPSDKYETGPWNSPEQAGENVLVSLHLNGETRLAVRDAFMVYASKVIAIAVDSPDGFKEGDGRKLSALISELRSALLGLPVT